MVRSSKKRFGAIPLKRNHLHFPAHKQNYECTFPWPVSTSGVWCQGKGGVSRKWRHIVQLRTTQRGSAQCGMLAPRGFVLRIARGSVIFGWTTLVIYISDYFICRDKEVASMLTGSYMLTPDPSSYAAEQAICLTIWLISEFWRERSPDARWSSVASSAILTFADFFSLFPETNRSSDRPIACAVIRLP